MAFDNSSQSLFCSVMTTIRTSVGDTMEECPYCGSELNGTANVHQTRSGQPVGRKSTGSDLVSCPDCDEVIDGFSAH